MSLPTAKTDPLVNQLGDLERLTASILRHFNERMGEREIEIEQFYQERSEGVFSPELVAIACALTGSESHEELFFDSLHERKDSDAQAVARIVKSLAAALDRELLR